MKPNRTLRGNLEDFKNLFIVFLNPNPGLRHKTHLPKPLAWSPAWQKVSRKRAIYKRAPQGFCLRSGSVANRTYWSGGHKVIFPKLTPMVRFQTEPTTPRAETSRFIHSGRFGLKTKRTPQPTDPVGAVFLLGCFF